MKINFVRERTRGWEFSLAISGLAFSDGSGSIVWFEIAVLFWVLSLTVRFLKKGAK